MNFSFFFKALGIRCKMEKDTVNLRHNNSFEIEVFKNVFWISANILGKTRYTDDDIKELVLLEPDEKKQKIENLYEAIQLFQASKFTGIIDNVNILEESASVIWTFHKDGFNSVRTNEGCCAADSNWLSYILENKYDETGCIGHCVADGNGHMTNYIKYEGWYYFVDMMMQRYDSVGNASIESGNLDDYKNNNAFGYIYKAKSFGDYIKFCLNACKKNPPVFFYKTTAPYCLCIGWQYHLRSKKYLYYFKEKPKKIFFKLDSVEILYSAKNIQYDFIDSTAIKPDWNSIKSFDFRSI